MRYLALTALFLVTACGHGLDPNDDTMSNDSAVDGLFSVHSEKKISCRNMSINVGLARDMMIGRGWVKDEAEFNSLFSVIHVSIENKRCIVGPSIGLIPLPGCVYGQYVPNSNYEYRNQRVEWSGPQATIYLNWDAGALAHELMHHYDYTHGRKELPAPHYHWTSLGYYRYADEYSTSRFQLNE